MATPATRVIAVRKVARRVWVLHEIPRPGPGPYTALRATSPASVGCPSRGGRELGPYTREKIENWVGDFCASDAAQSLSSGIREYAPELLTRFLVAACEARDVEPDEIDEPDLKPALLKLAGLDIPASIKLQVPALCGAMLAELENQGRLGGGRVLGAYVRALKEAFAEAIAGKPKPVKRAGSRIGRNDPCPCGSGKKYKKCCAKE